MKRLISILTILAAVLLTTSCQKELPDNLKNIDVSQGDNTPSSTSKEKYLRVSAESLSFTSPAGSLSFTITSNTSWSIKSDQDWCKVSSSSGTGNATITANVTENPSTSSRSATITINSNDAGSVKVSVTQVGANATLQLDMNNMAFDSSGGSESFSITSNTNWMAESNRSWCTLSSTSGLGDGKVIIIVSENTSTDSRTAIITVKAGNVTQTITITQVGAAPVDQSTRTFSANGVSFKMIRVDGGTFTMGATSEQGSDVRDDEKPAHQVTLSSYYIGETEVTQALWETVMGYSPTISFDSQWSSTYGLGNNYPAYNVSWNDCQDFIKKLNSITGENFRLPTEAEWEFAARGGNKSRGYKYAGSNTIDNVAWYYENSYAKGSSNSDYGTHNVATKQSNELGLYDMSGNVSEWCQDWYGSYSSNVQTNPMGPSSGSLRVCRGGGWYDSFEDCRDYRVSRRDCDSPAYGYDSLGLRLVL